jgi:phosphatidylserine/phosphatidylglycerophosphate/cardiolipin synthase-like enzyme
MSTDEEIERIRLDLTVEESQKLRWVKKSRGFTINTELIRILITEEFEKRGGKLEEPLVQINSDENGVLIHDKKLRKAVHVTFNRKGVNCDHHLTDECEHVAFALSIPKVQETIRKRKKEGWKLPDV